MDQKLEKLSENVNDIKTLINTFNSTLEIIEQRLSRLEKMDSIEHRVAVNQIDLSDIKESLQRVEGMQKEEVIKILKELEQSRELENNEQIKYIHRRLDSHLVKLAKAEEEIIILKTK
ncbi:hypothetical protein [Neobacillus sp. PS3-40]|jgi:hypothetical protein|uniref:hypothetical protein n=1 Tax=Neobacillus sp. PS3-40 TaxID=3070679 RepID=UPI0027E17D39|nr:hypothetical protein [Neobacillus sp. PS3-40]WML43254.1 hypothetical protein RCG20_15835 [Neobacillus sp. PS3-40]